jgi:hypothetical protein
MPAPPKAAAAAPRPARKDSTMELTAEEYLHRSMELMHLSEQLMEENPALDVMDAHFEAVGMLDALMSYAAQWDVDAAAERSAL